MFDVFISYKNTDASGKKTREARMADTLYHYLVSHGYDGRVFFSECELPKTGSGAYSKQIDKALDQAKVLIFVCDEPKFLKTSWVESEWRSFLDSIRAGTKKGEIYGLLSKRASPKKLPYSLRNVQCFVHPSGLSSLLHYIRIALREEKPAPAVNTKDRSIPSSADSVSDGRIEFKAKAIKGEGIVEKGVFRKKRYYRFLVKINIANPLRLELLDTKLHIRSGRFHKTKHIPSSERLSLELDVPLSKSSDFAIVSLRLTYRLSSWRKKKIRLSVAKRVNFQ